MKEWIQGINILIRRDTYFFFFFYLDYTLWILDSNKILIIQNKNILLIGRISIEISAFLIYQRMPSITLYLLRRENHTFVKSRFNSLWYIQSLFSF